MSHDFSAMSTAALVAEYNRLTGKNIKKFSSRAAGEKQVAAALSKAGNSSDDPAPHDVAGPAAVTADAQDTAASAEPQPAPEPAAAVAPATTQEPPMAKKPTRRASKRPSAPQLGPHTWPAAKSPTGATAEKAPKQPSQPKAEKPARAQPVKGAASADRSAAIAESWKNRKTAAARAERSRVRVSGQDMPDGTQEFRSVAAAFEALKLPMGQHIKFRGELKATESGRKSFEGFMFSIVKPKAQ